MRAAKRARRMRTKKDRKEERKGLEGQAMQEPLILVVYSGQTSQVKESDLLNPLVHSPPSGGQFKQYVQDIKPVFSRVKPAGNFFGSIRQALVSMLSVEVTEDVSQEEISPLKAEAPQNMLFILTTLEVSNEEISPLKAEALLNMNDISITFDVFHKEISSLKPW